MPNIYYYGKKTTHVGKTLYEILANLRNFGVNRMLIKQEELLRHPGKASYYIVKKVEPVMDEKLQEGAIYAERIFKGARMPGLSFVEQESWHTDWQLVPKHEESKYLVINPPEYAPIKVEPKPIHLPPLMKAFLERHHRAKGVTKLEEKLKIPLNYLPNETYEHNFDPSQPIHTILADRFRNKQT